MDTFAITVVGKKNGVCQVLTTTRQDRYGRALFDVPVGTVPTVAVTRNRRGEYAVSHDYWRWEATHELVVQDQRGRTSRILVMYRDCVGYTKEHWETRFTEGQPCFELPDEGFPFTRWEGINGETRRVLKDREIPWDLRGLRVVSSGETRRAPSAWAPLTPEAVQ